MINFWGGNFKYEKILKYCDLGMPDSVRGNVWKLLAGLSIEGRDNTLYQKLLEKAAWEKITLDQIKKDITRTMPDHVDFQEDGHGQTSLLNVLLAYSAYKPEVGYCQGMGFITAMFLMYMPEEVILSFPSPFSPYPFSFFLFLLSPFLPFLLSPSSFLFLFPPLLLS